MPQQGIPVDEDFVLVGRLFGELIEQKEAEAQYQEVKQRVPKEFFHSCFRRVQASPGQAWNGRRLANLDASALGRSERIAPGHYDR